MAAARVIPALWGVLVSSSPARTIFTPCCFQSKIFPPSRERNDNEYPSTAFPVQAREVIKRGEIKREEIKRPDREIQTRPVVSPSRQQLTPHGGAMSARAIERRL